jgi:hypothetical protein
VHLFNYTSYINRYPHLAKNPLDPGMAGVAKRACILTLNLSQYDFIWRFQENFFLRFSLAGGGPRTRGGPTVH